MSLDVFEYLTHLDQERYRAVILHATPEMGTAVTRFTHKVCAQAGGKYLDLLDLFIQNQELSTRIDSFSTEKFRALLLEQSKGAGLLVVDRADFLLDTWRRGERQDFLRLIKDQWDSFKDGMKAKLIFCLQTSQEIEKFHETSEPKVQLRVVRLSDFNDIA